MDELTEQSQVKGDIKLEERVFKGWEVLVRLFPTTFSDHPSLQGPRTCLLTAFRTADVNKTILIRQRKHTLSFCICFGDMEGQMNLCKKDVEVSTSLFPGALN